MDKGSSSHAMPASWSARPPGARALGDQLLVDVDHDGTSAPTASRTALDPADLQRGGRLPAQPQLHGAEAGVDVSLRRRRQIGGATGCTRDRRSRRWRAGRESRRRDDAAAGPASCRWRPTRRRRAGPARSGASRPVPPGRRAAPADPRPPPAPARSCRSGARPARARPGRSSSSGPDAGRRCSRRPRCRRRW